MFSKETYVRRRSELKKLVGNGLIILFGNNEAPANYPANTYSPMRQDSSFLYYFGQHRDGLVGVIDIDSDTELLLGDDIDVEDIVWMGFTPSVADLATEVGITKTAPMKELKAICDKAIAQHGSAGHPSFSAERACLSPADQGCGEDAFHEGAAGDSSH